MYEGRFGQTATGGCMVFILGKTNITYSTIDFLQKQVFVTRIRSVRNEWVQNRDLLHAERILYNNVMKILLNIIQ